MIRSISRLPGALIVWIISYAFFLLTEVANFSAAHDSINYLNGIIRGTDLFHQHHLLYHFAAHCWLVLTQPLFPSVPDYYLVEAFTAIWGSSSLAVIYTFFRKRFSLPGITAAAGTSVIGFSYGMWFYSVNIEVYAPPVFFLLAALYILTDPGFSQKQLWKLALLHCFAILFHQVNILFVVPVLYELFRRRNELHLSRTIALYALTGIVLTGGTYFIVGWFIEQHQSLTEWVAWMQGYTVGHGYWQPLSWKTPLNVAAGFSHAFIGGHYIFQLPFIEDYFQRSFQSHGLKDEQFLSSNISPAAAWVLTLMTFVVAIVLFYFVFRLISGFAVIRARSARLVRPLLVSIVTYSLFFCFWMPEILEFWIFQMVLVWLLFIGIVPILRFPFNIPILPGLILLSGLLFSINYFGSLRWLQHIEHDWYYSRVDKVRRSVMPNDLMLVEDGWILKDYLKYFTGAAVVSAGDPDFDRHKTDSIVRQTLSSKGKIYIYADPPGMQAGYIDSLLGQYPQSKKIFNTPDPLIFVIE